jgi:hypothetical protein
VIAGDHEPSPQSGIIESRGTGVTDHRLEASGLETQVDLDVVEFEEGPDEREHALVDAFLGDEDQLRPRAPGTGREIVQPGLLRRSADQRDETGFQGVGPFDVETDSGRGVQCRYGDCAQIVTMTDASHDPLGPKHLSIVSNGKRTILDAEEREGSTSAIAPRGEFPPAFRDGVTDRNLLLRIEGAFPHLGRGHLDDDPLGEEPAELAHYSPGWYERSR